MKLSTTLSLGLLLTGAAYAQKTAAPAKTAAAMKADKCIISGTFRDMRKLPIKGVEAFVYKPDSTIVASGMTDAMGHFETNSVVPGDYYVKIIYPNSRANTIITGISIKRPGNTIIDMKGEAPAADTTMAYTALMPKPEPAKPGMKKK